MVQAILGTVLMFVVVCSGLNYAQSLVCHAKARDFEAVEYGFFQGCMVKHRDRWLPLENIRGFD